MMRKLSRQIFVVLVVAAWAASLAPSDARGRGGKHAPNAARPVGVQPPAGGGAAKARGNASPVIREIPAITKRNAVGAATPSAGVSPPTPGLATIPRPNAAGVTKSNPMAARPATVTTAPKIVPGASPTTFVRSAAPAHGGGIGGTAMTRGTTPAVIGGPAKLAGGISGTGMKPKR
jgi:hypothetical protein